jgi:hypothetical protein
MFKASVVVVAGAMLGLVFGCGGSDGGSTSEATATVDKAQFLKKVNRLCAQTENKKYKEIGVAFRRAAKGKKFKEPTQEDLELVTVQVIVPVYSEMMEKLSAMPAPAGQEDEFSTMVAKFESDISRTREEPKRYLEGVAFTEGDKAAETLGLQKCSF